MKILHTADWHIGKKLHNYQLAEDFNRFINWLITCIQEEEIEVLLVSGDVFDLANPSSAARNQYYESLVALKKHVSHIILTGGNHDSPAMLNAPKEMLKALNLDVIGGLPDQIEEALIPLKNKDGATEAVVAALPFLRNPDLKTTKVLRNYEERLKALREGIAHIFGEAAKICQEKYPDVPAIAMGHLFAAGVETSESERDIQIGNQAAVSSSAFGNYFKYVALGHIHKPQKVSAKQPVYYSGSPLPLSFSERADHKRVLLLDTDKSWTPKSIPVPSFRKLIKISGDLATIQNRLKELPEHQESPHLIELELKEQDYQINKINALEDLVAEFDQSGYKIVKHRIQFEHALRQTGAIFDEQVELQELQPGEVFLELLKQQDFQKTELEDIKSAFYELLEEVESAD